MGQGGCASGGFPRTWLNNKLWEILWNIEKVKKSDSKQASGKIWVSRFCFFMTTPARTRPKALESSWIILDGICLIIRHTVRILRRATATGFQTWRPGSQRSSSTTTRKCRQAWMSGWSLRRQNSMTMELISLCTVMISASIWTATMLKNNLRLWLSNLNNKKCFFSLGYFLFQNVSYFLDSPRIFFRIPKTFTGHKTERQWLTYGDYSSIANCWAKTIAVFWGILGIVWLHLFYNFSWKP